MEETKRQKNSLHFVKQNVSPWFCYILLCKILEARLRTTFLLLIFLSYKPLNKNAFFDESFCETKCHLSFYILMYIKRM